MDNNLIHHKWAIILCGGRGERLGHITDSIPKPLVEVGGKPILWYILYTLYKKGFRRFFFPLGYKGNMIESFVHGILRNKKCEYIFLNTGHSTPVADRLNQCLPMLPDKDDFFILNGDTIFDFDIFDMLKIHLQSNALLTISSVEVIMSYGMIIKENGEIKDFVKNKKMSHLILRGSDKNQALINAGFIWINKNAFELIDLQTCDDFEVSLFSEIITIGRAVHYELQGLWFPVETQKDIRVLNHSESLNPEMKNLIETANSEWHQD